MLTLVVLLLSLSTVTALIPFKCDTVNARASRVCCPPHKGSPCGWNVNRGECKDLPRKGARIINQTSFDMRYVCPPFDKMCVCRHPFDGCDCGSCKPGWTGENCENFTVLKRREIRQLSEVERNRLFCQLNFCKKLQCAEYVIECAGDRRIPETYYTRRASYLDVWIYSVYCLSKPLLNNDKYYNRNFMYDSSGFCTSRHASLLFLEHLMRLCTKNSSFVMPYYDPSMDPNCTMCSNSFMGASDAQGNLDKSCIFSTWREMCASNEYDRQLCVMPNCTCQRPLITRNPGAAPGAKMYSRQDVLHLLNMSTYDTPDYDSTSKRCFRNALNGNIDSQSGTIQGSFMSKMWQTYIGGTMDSPLTCANDPMFMLHLCFCHKIFTLWMRKYNISSANYPESTQYHHAPDHYICCVYPPVTHRAMMAPDPGVEYTMYKNL